MKDCPKKESGNNSESRQTKPTAKMMYRRYRTPGGRSTSYSPREVLDGESTSKDPGPQVETDGDPKGPRLGHAEAPQWEGSLRGTTEYIAWDWRRTFYIVMSTMTCFPVQIFTPLVLILQTQTELPIYD